eukprot:402509_1
MAFVPHVHLTRHTLSQSLLRSLDHHHEGGVDPAKDLMKDYPHGGGSARNVDDDGIFPDQEIWYNAPTAVLYELALKHERGSVMTNTGALACLSGKKTGRSPKDKRVVDEPSS